MNDHFKNIAASLIKEGFLDLKDEVLDFKLTAYSLHTKLSFKFGSFYRILQTAQNSLQNISEVICV